MLNVNLKCLECKTKDPPEKVHGRAVRLVMLTRIPQAACTSLQRPLDWWTTWPSALV